MDEGPRLSRVPAWPSHGDGGSAPCPRAKHRPNGRAPRARADAGACRRCFHTQGRPRGWSVGQARPHHAADSKWHATGTRLHSLMGGDTLGSWSLDGECPGSPCTVLRPCWACDPLSTVTLPGVLGSQSRRLGCRRVEERSAQAPGLSLRDGALGLCITQGLCRRLDQGKGNKAMRRRRHRPARSPRAEPQAPGVRGQGRPRAGAGVPPCGPDWV